MLTIGPRVCIWTTLLLLCSIPTIAQPANETASSSSVAVTISESSIQTTAPSLTSFSGKSSHSTTYSPDTTCPFRTINYITHTLPQQCLKTSWTAPASASSADGDVGAPASTGLVAISGISGVELDERKEARQTNATSTLESQSADVSSDTSSSTTSVDTEVETDSPLDNANFLSFEDWKKKNLAKAGQSPENLGQGRVGSTDTKPRRRPVNINDLDSLGEDSEIEIDFGGFGNTGEQTQAPSTASEGTHSTASATKVEQEEGNVAPSSWALGKDAGKTCKERFNYASFDCAATVLKTNPKAKSSSSILVENKDSYMLNECSADNKFLIVELCDDILVDTIVLANYEFFSSMFRHFRVSVSDRYPVKMDRWRVLDTFEARNTRDIQPFLIKVPQIWARYLRIEFLTQYGNEFYCPISLLRVHGTTMMEQFRREEEEARGDDDFSEPIEAADGDPVRTAAPVVDNNESKPTIDSPQEPEKALDTSSMESNKADKPSEPPKESTSMESQAEMTPTSERSESAGSATNSSGSATSVSDARGQLDNSASGLPLPAEPATGANDKMLEPGEDSKISKNDVPISPSAKPTQGPESKLSNASTNSSSTNSASSVVSNPKTSGNETASTHSSSTNGKPSNPTNTTQVQSQSRSPSSPTQPNTASPTTQESFFKSIHKRLQQLEANSTLSLQYIEEQSRILRDAFIKVEKRQLSKTETFLDHLNNTVVHELKSYRSMYDQLWQSTILELEGMKERNQREIGELGARMSLMADELVWQKRMAVVQSTLLLLCLGLVLFVRSGTLGSQVDIPIVQQLGNKYSRFSFFDTPPDTPNTSSGRRKRGFRMWRSDTSGLISGGHLSDGGQHAGHLSSDGEMDGHRSPVQIEFSPPTPTTPHESISNLMGEANSSLPQVNGVDHGPETPDEEIVQASSNDTQRVKVLATQSGPATPRGSRDSRKSWMEVDRELASLKAKVQRDDLASELEVQEERGSKQRPSPLRRNESYDGTIEDTNDSGPSDEGMDVILG